MQSKPPATTKLDTDNDRGPMGVFLYDATSFEILHNIVILN